MSSTKYIFFKVIFFCANLKLIFLWIYFSGGKILQFPHKSLKLAKLISSKIRYIKVPLFNTDVVCCNVDLYIVIVLLGLIKCYSS